MVHQRDGDIGHQQARDRLVDGAVVAQRADSADPDAAGDHAGHAPSARMHDERRRAGSAAAPIAAAATPPSTIAPSPPMTTRPSRAGSATQSAASSSGAARDSVFWTENQLPKPPRHISSKSCAGDLPTSADEDAEQRHADDQRGERDRRRLPPAARSIRAPARRLGRRSMPACGRAACHVSVMALVPRVRLQAVEPTTPSTR